MKIEHIAMYVNDLESARDFFVKYLDAVPNDGYHNPKTDFRSYFLSFDDGARLEDLDKISRRNINRSGSVLNRNRFVRDRDTPKPIRSPKKR